MNGSSPIPCPVTWQVRWKASCWPSKTIRTWCSCSRARRRLVGEFFLILLSARLAIGAPAKVLRQGDRALGLVMGYATERPDWPAPWQERWRLLQAGCGVASGMFAQSDAASARHEPHGDHCYLGVVGLHPSLRGMGSGAALVGGFCDIADADPRAEGTCIETCIPRNVPFYERSGFALTGQEALDDVTTHFCLYRPSLRHRR